MTGATNIALGAAFVALSAVFLGQSKQAAKADDATKARNLRLAGFLFIAAGIIFMLSGIVFAGRG